MSVRGISNAGGGTAWGNIFTVQTPYLDNLGKQIYAQEQQRQLQQQKESDILDQQFSREVSNIRDADVNEYADKYNQWKQAKIGLMKMNPRNQKDYLNAQLDANRKLADMSQFSANSIANKAQFGQIGKALVTDKNGEYKDNASDMYRQAMQTPSSKLNTLTYQDETGQVKPYDPLNPDQYKYEGNMVKWQPILTKAEGTKPIEVAGNSTPITDKNGAVLGTNNTTIKAKNSPLDYYTQLVGSLTGSGAQKSLNATFKFSDDEAQQIVEDYQNKVANNPLAQKAWGDGVKLPLNALLVPATRTAALQSMRYALSNLPQETAPKPVYNKVAMQDKSQQFSQEQQGRSFNQREKMAYLNNGLIKGRADYNRAANSKDQENVLNKFNDNTYNAGTTTLNGTTIDHITIGGKDYKGRIVDIPKSLKSSFSIYQGKDKNGNNSWKTPQAYYMTDDKKTIIPLFLNKGKTASGGYYIQPESKPVDIQNYKAELSKLLLTKSKTGNEVTDEYGADESDGQQEQQDNSYNIKGKKYTHSDLNKMGYTDEQIKQAVKLGTIK